MAESLVFEDIEELFETSNRQIHRGRGDVSSVAHGRNRNFFYNQVRKDHETVYTGVGDFFVDGRFVFEVGGPGKSYRQIRDLPDSYIVQGGLEIGQGDCIPLWIFGLLY